MYSVLLLVALSFILTDCAAPHSPQRPNRTAHILALVPLLQERGGTVPDASWEKGWEILPGAQIAVNAINSDGTILPGNTLELIAVGSNSCKTTTNSLEEFVKVATNESNNIVALIGMFCPREVYILSPLASQLNIKLQLSGSASPKLFNNHQYPDLFHMVQSTEVLARTLFLLMDHYNWTRLTIITEASNSFYLQTAEEVYRMARQNSSRVTVVSFLQNPKVLFDDVFVASNSRVLFLSLNVPDAYNVICRAYFGNLTWPEYVWIVHSHQMEDFHQHSIFCNPEEMLEGVVFIQQRLSPIFRGMYQIYNMSFPGVNPYANILYDSVWATALALNNGADGYDRLDYDGVSGHVKFTNGTREEFRVDIYQVRNRTQIDLGYINNNNTLIIITDISDAERDINDDKDRPRYFIIIILYFNDALATVFTTTLLALYCYFRNRESIKATSFSLSIMIFMGSYLILAYTFTSDTFFLPQYQHLSSNYRKFECVIRIFLNGLGIPLVLILSTLMVKMLRVYYIFLSPSKLRYSSNTALTLYVVILVIPCVIVTLIWILDIHDGRIDKSLAVGLERCGTGGRLFLYVSALFVYTFGLMVTLVVVAIKTRKIRYKHFKDTKKVNTLIFLLTITIAFTLTYWFILISIEGDRDETIQRIVLHVGHMIALIECQGLLFVPKIYPLVMQVICGKNQACLKCF